MEKWRRKGKQIDLQNRKQTFRKQIYEYLSYK